MKHCKTCSHKVVRLEGHADYVHVDDETTAEWLLCGEAWPGAVAEPDDD